MTIKELQQRIDGELTMMFDYKVSATREFYELMLDAEQMTTERVREITSNGFVAELRNMYDASVNKTTVKAFVRQQDITEVEFVEN